MEFRCAIIEDVVENSPAEKAGIKKGEVLININGYDIKDELEYRFANADENFEIVVQDNLGVTRKIHLNKSFYEDLGIILKNDDLKNPKSCHNKCVFCFIDQLPPGMRESLYFKDDDSRLSFLHGNFVTLTNMKDDDLDRIIKFKISPINVSVHTTNPELRIKMLNNKNAGNVLEKIKKLIHSGIKINCQIVLCPGINDGEELVRTLNDLSRFYPGISDVAIVPVGITKFRDNLFKLKPYDKETSLATIKQVEELQEKFIKAMGTPFARLSDEFYILGGKNFPVYEHYEDFSQLVDGIGMVTYLRECVNDELEFNKIDGKKASFGIITGTLSSSILKAVCDKINSKLNVEIKVYPVENNFFGNTITVAGLLTGEDIINQLKGKIKEDVIFIPSSMLKADSDVFLDGITLKELEETLDIRIVKCDYTGEDLVNKIINEVIECQNK